MKHCNFSHKNEKNKKCEFFLTCIRTDISDYRALKFLKLYRDKKFEIIKNKDVFKGIIELNLYPSHQNFKCDSNTYLKINRLIECISTIYLKDSQAYEILLELRKFNKGECLWDSVLNRLNIFGIYLPDESPIYL